MDCWAAKGVAVALTALAVGVGCSNTVAGQARRAPTGAGERGFGYADDRCGLLADSSIQQTLHADHVVRPYSGAVCQYVLSRPAQRPADGAEMVDVVFSWFASGRLSRERELARRRGAQLTDTLVERREAFLARRDVTGAACAATAAADPGVLSWWVQFRDRADGDPCRDAETLLSTTLQAEL